MPALGPSEVMQRVETSAGLFAYLSQGPDDGEVVLCLHGFPDQPPTFEALLPELAAAGFRAIAPWMRGYAPSTMAGPYTAERLADDVIALADTLSPGRPVRVVGHDWGAFAAYAAAAGEPNRIARAVTMAVPHPARFVANLRRHPAQLAHSWYILFFQLPLLPERVLVARDGAMVRKLWRDWSPGFEPRPGYLDELVATLRQSLPAPIAYYRDAARTMLRGGGQGRGARITVPTLHLHGADDGCVAPEMSDGEERCFDGPFARELVPDTGHWLHLERPGEVNARIVDFLTRMA